MVIINFGNESLAIEYFYLFLAVSLFSSYLLPIEMTSYKMSNDILNV